MVELGVPLPSLEHATVGVVVGLRGGPVGVELFGSCYDEGAGQASLEVALHGAHHVLGNLFRVAAQRDTDSQVSFHGCGGGSVEVPVAHGDLVEGAPHDRIDLSGVHRGEVDGVPGR